MFDTPEERKQRQSADVEWGYHDLLPLVYQLEPDELLLLREHIDAKLPVKELKHMNLEQELVIQYQVAKALQTTTLNSNEESNRKAQTVSTCAATLQNIVKLQTELHTAERFKEIESRLIRSLEKIPEEYLHEFFDWYEDEANK